MLKLKFEEIGHGTGNTTSADGLNRAQAYHRSFPFTTEPVERRVARFNLLEESCIAFDLPLLPRPAFGSFLFRLVNPGTFENPADGGCGEEQFP